MNNSLSAHWQVLIKKSGRTIERLAPNSEVVNLKCFSIQVASFHLSFHMCKKKKNDQDSKQGQDILKTPSEWRSFSRCLVILYQPFGGTKGLEELLGPKTLLFESPTSAAPS